MNPIVKEAADMLKSGTPAVFVELVLNEKGFNTDEAEGIVWAAQTHNSTPDQAFFNGIEADFRSALNAR